MLLLDYLSVVVNKVLNTAWMSFTQFDGHTLYSYTLCVAYCLLVLLLFACKCIVYKYVNTRMQVGEPNLG